MYRFAIYVSNHGFGHATRCVALAREFNSFGISCHIISKRPQFLFNSLEPELNLIHYRAIDTGVKHGSQLSTDKQATKSALLQLLGTRNRILEEETSFLRENKIDLIITDAPYLIAEAAVYAGIPLFCITNFDWHYIYQEVFCDDESMKPVINLIWALYQKVNASFVLPFSHQASCSALPRQTHCGLLARKLDKYVDLREKNGWAKDEPILLVSFGGEGAMELDYEALCQAFPGKVLSKQGDVLAKNHYLISAETDFLDYLYNADIVLCKPGYSTLAEAVQFNKFIIYCPRENYPEETALLAGLDSYPNKQKTDSLDMTSLQWKALFKALPKIKPLPEKYINQNTQICSKILNEFFLARNTSARMLSVFDLGSNNLNYLLFDLASGQIVHKAHWTTGLGRNFNGNSLSTYRISQAKAVIKQAVEYDANIESEKIMLGTGVSRLASNAVLIKRWVEKAYNISYRIIEPEEEIRFVYHAALPKKSGGGTSLAIDFGGASTELIELNSIRKPIGISLPIGLLSLLQLELQDHCVAMKEMEVQLHKAPWRKVNQLIGIGLSYSYLVAAMFRVPHLDPVNLDDFKINRIDLERLLDNLEKGNSEIYIPYLLEPRYLPILRLSATFSLILLDRFAASEILVCSDGIAVGYARWRKNKNKVNK